MADPTDFNDQAIIDGEHLKLLSIGYRISPGFNAFFMLFGLFYVFMGVVSGEMIRLSAETNAKPGGPPPAFIGWFLAARGLALFRRRSYVCHPEVPRGLEPQASEIAHFLQGGVRDHLP
ncbi:MAG TPA: hypothetical protein VN885_08345 [Candidatus Acidoferrales bacterium]|nr:hypothetical protein [Candidatus Acidoferrales bacterium]